MPPDDITAVLMDWGGVVHDISTRVPRPSPKCDVNMRGVMRVIGLFDAVQSKKPPCRHCFRGGWPYERKDLPKTLPWLDSRVRE